MALKGARGLIVWIGGSWNLPSHFFVSPLCKENLQLKSIHHHRPAEMGLGCCVPWIQLRFMGREEHRVPHRWLLIYWEESLQAHAGAKEACCPGPLAMALRAVVPLGPICFQVAPRAGPKPGPPYCLQPATYSVTVVLGYLLVRKRSWAPEVVVSELYADREF